MSLSDLLIALVAELRSRRAHRGVSRNVTAVKVFGMATPGDPNVMHRVGPAFLPR
jgi:hypothetical protein